MLVGVDVSASGCAYDCESEHGKWTPLEHALVADDDERLAVSEHDCARPIPYFFSEFVSTCKPTEYARPFFLTPRINAAMPPRLERAHHATARMINAVLDCFARVANSLSQLPQLHPYSPATTGAALGATIAMAMNERTTFTGVALGASIGAAAMACIRGADAHGNHHNIVIRKSLETGTCPKRSTQQPSSYKNASSRCSCTLHCCKQTLGVRSPPPSVACAHRRSRHPCCLLG